MIILHTPRLHIKTLETNDANSLAAFELKNKHFWSATSSTIGQDPSSEEYWVRNLPQFQKEFNEGRSIRFAMFLSSDLTGCIGVCNFTQLFRGPFQACYLGYKVDADFEGQGLMQEALRKAISYMFEEQNVHRIMANYMPRNTRSQKLLAKLGFQHEGYAKEYLLIDGIWEDHVLTALTNKSWKGCGSGA